MSYFETDDDMKAIISTTIQANAAQMWAELQKTNSLMQVASSILAFRPRNAQALSATWEVGHTYALDLFAFHILPLGKHDIHVRHIDVSKLEIFTNERGSLTKTWNHRIRVEPLNESMLRYTDEIEIGAGVLTLFVWAFAQIFYRHRQRRWKALLTNE